MNQTSSTQLIKEFRDGIFALRTRRFGSVAEIMIKKLYELDDSDSLAYDKRDSSSGERVEVKFSTVMKENEDTIRDENVVDQCLKANLANRVMRRSETNTYKFDCNIQQVKRKEFDVLYYGIFFSDEIEIFCVRSDEITHLRGYSDRQHRGNEGEGQFHVNNKTISYHREHYLKCVCTYEELFNLFAHDIKPKFWTGH